MSQTTLDPRIKEKRIYEMSDSTLDSIVQEKLGYKKYQFVPVEECGNDSSHSYDGVNGHIDAWDQEHLDKFASGGFSKYCTGAVLNKLVKDGHLPKGDYVIAVCW